MEISEWVMVASRVQAKIFNRKDSQGPLKWIYTLPNRDEHTPRHGGKEIPFFEASAEDDITIENFAKKIAEALKVGWDQKSFNKLHLFAEPHLLGRIKQQIPKSMKEAPIEWIPKDLEKATAQEIAQRIE